MSLLRLLALGRSLGRIHNQPSRYKISGGEAAAAAPAPRRARRGWSLFRNPFSGPSKSGLARTPVQAELALERVKPLRNDLSDSDLEVVATKRKSSSPFSAGTEKSEKSEKDEKGGKGGKGGKGAAPEKKVWSRIKAQYFRAEKV